MHESSEDEGGITMDDLRKACTKVKGRINIIKTRSLLKENRRNSTKIRKLDEFTEKLKQKGIDVNEESLATRVRNPRRIGDLEAAQDAKFKKELGISDDSDDSDIDDDEVIKIKEGEERGRKTRAEERGNSKSKTPAKKMLGKRAKNDDVEMVSDDENGIDRNVRGSLGKNARSMTPSQRKISVKKLLRDRTSSRREGSEP